MGGLLAWLFIIQTTMLGAKTVPQEKPVSLPAMVPALRSS